MVFIYAQFKLKIEKMGLDIVSQICPRKQTTKPKLVILV